MKKLNVTYKMNPAIVKKHFDALVYLKNKLDTYENYPLAHWKSDCGISSKTLTIVKRLGIVNNVGGNVRGAKWEWNTKIPITMKLATTLIAETRKEQNEYRRNVLKKKTVNVTAKIELKERKIKTIPKSNVGLIRRFFRWIY